MRYDLSEKIIDELEKRFTLVEFKRPKNDDSPSFVSVEDMGHHHVPARRKIPFIVVASEACRNFDDAVQDWWNKFNQFAAPFQSKKPVLFWRVKPEVDDRTDFSTNTYYCKVYARLAIMDCRS